MRNSQLTALLVVVCLMLLPFITIAQTSDKEQTFIDQKNLIDSILKERQKNLSFFNRTL